MRRDLVLFFILVVVLSTLIACAQAELPAGSAITTPFVEFSLDGDETWNDLFKDEVRRIPVDTVKIRQTECGRDLNVSVKGEPGFRGTIKRENNYIIVKGRGEIMIIVSERNYAKIILEGKE